MDNLDRVLFVFLGWLLGLLSPIIVQEIRRRREAQEVRAALDTEIHELRNRLAIIAYFIEREYGEVNRNFLEWLQPVLYSYRGIHGSETKDLLTAIEWQLTFTDEKIAEQAKSRPGKGVSLRKFQVPFLDTRIPSFSWFDRELQNQLLELKTEVDLINDDVDQVRFFMEWIIAFAPQLYYKPPRCQRGG